MYGILSLWKRLFLLFLFPEESVCADLDDQLHGWSIDTIDDNDGCIIFLEEFEKHAVGDDGATVAAHPLIIPDGHERGVMVTVGIDDGTRLETAKISRFCDGNEFSVHGVLRFLSELVPDCRFRLKDDTHALHIAWLTGK